MSEVDLKNITYGKKMVNGKYEIDYEKWIDLSVLSRFEDNKYIGKINWSNSIGKSIYFKYKGNEGSVKVIAYNRIKREITLIYNKMNFNVNTSVFRSCNIGKVLGIRTSEFKIEIGQVFRDKKRDLIITDRNKMNKNRGGHSKYYKFICNKCGFDSGKHYNNAELIQEYWVEESSLLKK